MDQISETFSNIDWDNVLTVVTDYLTKINVEEGITKLMDFFKGIFDITLGGILGGILG